MENFEIMVEKTIESLFEAIMREIGDMAEVDLEGGILNVELDDGRVFIINKHSPNRQIWLSSPLSGAHHFSFNEGAGDEGAGAWVSTRDAGQLLGLLEDEFAIIKGGPVNLV
ncbi:MAG: iron donor protein CyaY [Rhodospirillaceae bacterium]|nr:iron donor protein CyaY [Rhodospirillaceae bacterium]